MKSKGYFICGTDTNVGKTFISALLVKALDADYWKPIQCGDLENSDTMTVRKFVGPNFGGILHREKYALKLPQSPHLAARSEHIKIHLDDFILPQSESLILVEGAGGCLAPINEEETILDLVEHLNLPLILVTRFYLGAYNHTLMSLESIQRRDLRIEGLILNDGDNPDFRDYITRKTKLDFLGIVPKLSLDNSVEMAHLVKTLRDENYERLVR